MTSIARDPRDIARDRAASAAITDMDCATGFSAGVRWCLARLDELGERPAPEVALAILIESGRKLGKGGDMTQATIPQTPEKMAAAICDAMWCGAKANAYLDDPAFKDEFERVADLVQRWIAAARAQALEGAARLMEQSGDPFDEFSHPLIATVRKLGREVRAKRIRALAAKDAGQ